MGLHCVVVVVAGGCDQLAGNCVCNATRCSLSRHGMRTHLHTHSQHNLSHGASEARLHQAQWVKSLKLRERSSQFGLGSSNSGHERTSLNRNAMPSELFNAVHARPVERVAASKPGHNTCRGPGNECCSGCQQTAPHTEEHAFWQVCCCCCSSPVAPAYLLAWCCLLRLLWLSLFLSLCLRLRTLSGCCLLLPAAAVLASAAV